MNCDLFARVLIVGTKLRYRFCKVQTAASAVRCGWMWSEKLNKRKSDGGMTGDVCYRICNIDRSLIVVFLLRCVSRVDWRSRRLQDSMGLLITSNAPTFCRNYHHCHKTTTLITIIG